ncbi:hypothetical protein EDD17DRAFT_1564101, partial [Pisolithus thermaeus]
SITTSTLASDQPELATEGSVTSERTNGLQPAARNSRRLDDGFYGGSRNHLNYSVDSFPPPEPDSLEHVPPLPSYNATSLVDNLNSLYINDHPGSRGIGVHPFASDPVSRPNTSMALQNSGYRAPHPSRYPNSLSPVPSVTSMRNRRPGVGPYTHYPADDMNMAYQVGEQPRRHSGGFGNTAHQPAVDTDFRVAYPSNDQGTGSSSGYAQSDSSSAQHQMAWHGSHPNLTPNYGYQGQVRRGKYDHLYAAASDVLGMGPPPQSHAGPSAYLPYSAYPDQVALPTSQSTPYLHPSAPGPYHPAPPPPGGSGMVPYTPTLPQVSGVDEAEFELRSPSSSLQRSESVSLQTKTTKAYRQRIKADPDPEAHFKYAKYLIEAAKKIGANAKDKRAVKKFQENLIQEALKTIRRLATQNEPYDEAQFFLANCYGTGMLGLQVDHERAYHLYLQAAKQNHAAASYRVAVCNELGAGTRREPPRAAVFYRKAASLGDTAAMYKLGMILLLGSLGEQKNPREAINWLKRAAEQADEENPHALHELATLHEMPNSGLVPHDPAYAKALFTQAGHLGYVQSQYKLGQCYEYGALTCPVDPRRSIAWYTKAAEKGYAEAELALSGWYLTGSEGVLKQSDSEAYLWARKAANKGLSKAEYAVGYYAEVGIGIKQDIEFAKRWYMRAAAQGNKRAMSRLTEMKRMGNKRSNVGRPTRQQAKDECVIC